MMDGLSSVIVISIWFAGLCLALAVAATVWRLLRGPSAADRIIATDMLGLLALGIAALVAAVTGHRGFLDVAFGIAVFAFLAAVAFGMLLERTAARTQSTMSGKEHAP